MTSSISLTLGKGRLDTEGARWYLCLMNETINYVTDAEGKRTSVLVPIEKFESLMEDLTDLAAIADRRSEPTISHSDFVKELAADGFL